MASHNHGKFALSGRDTRRLDATLPFQHDISRVRIAFAMSISHSLYRGVVRSTLWRPNWGRAQHNSYLIPPLCAPPARIVAKSPPEKGDTTENRRQTSPWLGDLQCIMCNPRRRTVAASTEQWLAAVHRWGVAATGAKVRGPINATGNPASHIKKASGTHATHRHRS